MKASKSQDETLNLENGKYSFSYRDGVLKCRRYGESWREFTGDKAIYALYREAFDSAFEILELEGKLADMEEDLRFYRDRARDLANEG